MNCKNPVIAFEAYRGYCYSESGGSTLASLASEEVPQSNWIGFPIAPCDTAECTSVVDRSSEPVSFNPGQLRTFRQVVKKLTSFHLDGSVPQPGHIGFKSDFIKDPRQREYAVKKLETYCRDPQTLPQTCDEQCEAMSQLQCNAVLETLNSGKDSFWNSWPFKVLAITLGGVGTSYFVGYGFQLGGAHAARYSPQVVAKALWRQSIGKIVEFFSKKGPPQGPPTQAGSSGPAPQPRINEVNSANAAAFSALQPSLAVSTLCGGAGVFYTTYVTPDSKTGLSNSANSVNSTDALITGAVVATAGAAISKAGFWQALGSTLSKLGTAAGEVGLAAETAIFSLIPDSVLRRSLYCHSGECGTPEVI